MKSFNKSDSISLVIQLQNQTKILSNPCQRIITKLQTREKHSAEKKSGGTLNQSPSHHENPRSTRPANSHVLRSSRVRRRRRIKISHTRVCIRTICARDMHIVPGHRGYVSLHGLLNSPSRDSVHWSH